MSIHKTREQQLAKLAEICEGHGVNFRSLQHLLQSVKTKRLFKRSGYHQTTINEEIEKAVQ